MWQSCIEIIPLRIFNCIAELKARYYWTSVKPEAHMHFVDSSDIYIYKVLWALFLTEVQWCGTQQCEICSGIIYTGMSHMYWLHTLGKVWSRLVFVNIAKNHSAQTGCIPWRKLVIFCMCFFFVYSLFSSWASGILNCTHLLACSAGEATVHQSICYNNRSFTSGKPHTFPR